MRNRQVADLFDQLGKLIEVRGLRISEAKAYRKAAHFIRSLSKDVAELSRTGKLPQVPELGPHLARKVREVLETGRLRRLEDLLEPVGEEILKLLSLPKVKVATLAKVHSETGITRMKDLVEAVRRGPTGDLGRVLTRRELASLKAGLAQLDRKGHRRPLGEVYPLVEQTVGILRGSTGSTAILAVGPFRRGLAWLDRGDIYAAVPREDVDAVRDIFCSIPGMVEARPEERWRASALAENGFPLHLRCVPEGHLGCLSVVASASRTHVEALRARAKGAGLRLAREYLYRGRRRVGAKDEAAFYELLGLPWIPPELREGAGEVAAAAAGRLPSLVKATQVHGDLHVHTVFSDGGSGLEEIAEAAARNGWAYVATADHSRGLAEARGLPIARLRRRNEEIDAFNARGGPVVLLKAAEVEIHPDGSLDYPPAVLAELDLVVGAVHHVRKSRGWMTDRIVRALRTGWIDVLAHPTGSLVGQRPPYPVDLDEVFAEAIKQGVACEINSHRKRMDLGERDVRRAIEAGVTLSIGSDAHHADAMWMVRLGVGIARRAAAPRAAILNTLSLDELKTWITRRRPEFPPLSSKG